MISRGVLVGLLNRWRRFWMSSEQTAEITEAYRFELMQRVRISNLELGLVAGSKRSKAPTDPTEIQKQKQKQDTINRVKREIAKAIATRYPQYFGDYYTPSTKKKRSPSSSNEEANLNKLFLLFDSWDSTIQRHGYVSSVSVTFSQWGVAIATAAGLFGVGFLIAPTVYTIIVAGFSTTALIAPPIWLPMLVGLIMGVVGALVVHRVFSFVNSSRLRTTSLLNRAGQEQIVRFREIHDDVQRLFGLDPTIESEVRSAGLSRHSEGVAQQNNYLIQQNAQLIQLLNRQQQQLHALEVKVTKAGITTGTFTDNDLPSDPVQVEPLQSAPALYSVPGSSFVMGAAPPPHFGQGGQAPLRGGMQPRPMPQGGMQPGSWGVAHRPPPVYSAPSLPQQPAAAGASPDLLAGAGPALYGAGGSGGMGHAFGATSAWPASSQPSMGPPVDGGHSQDDAEGLELQRVSSSGSTSSLLSNHGGG